jgi:glycosyltransferase involved in cell wall biosynthesis
MKISYAVTVCNEFIEIQRLITFLLQHKRPQDEIVVQMDLTLDDMKNHPEDKRQVHSYLMKHNVQGNIRLAFCPLNNDFAAFKNNLTQHCTGDYIFQIDADEVPCTPYYIESLTSIYVQGPILTSMCTLVPRVNTVEGHESGPHAAMGLEMLMPNGWVNWPDWQHGESIATMVTVTWQNKVHESPCKPQDNLRNFASMEEEYALISSKNN